MISESGFEKAIAILDTEAEVNSRTSLLPAEICAQVVDRIDAEPKKTDLHLAHEFVVRLLACYPNLKPHDPKNYTTSLVAVFANYPPSIGRRVADPVRGLASTLKYDPKVPDVTAALEAEVKRRQLIRANALWHNQERETRRKLQEAEADFAKHRLDEEARRAQVAEYLRSKPIHDAPRPMTSTIDKSALFEAYDKDMAELQERRAAKHT